MSSDWSPGSRSFLQAEPVIRSTASHDRVHEWPDEQLATSADDHERTCTMRIEVQPGPQYAWSFAKD